VETTINKDMYSYLSPEQRVPEDHPLRVIRKIADAVFEKMSREFDKHYKQIGRPSIAPRFLELYPRHEWTSDSVLRFWNDAFPQSPRDDIRIFNGTDDAITYLNLNAGSVERLLILDLLPKAVTTLSVQQESDLRWISCTGKFNLGDAISESGVNFQGPHVPGPTNHYGVSILRHEVSIQSREIDGLKISVSGEKTTSGEDPRLCP
jgi:hypothetical protein